MAEHLELSGSSFADLVESLRKIGNLAYIHKDTMPEICYGLLIAEVKKCNDILKELTIVKDTYDPMDIVRDFQPGKN